MINVGDRVRFINIPDDHAWLENAIGTVVEKRGWPRVCFIVQLDELVPRHGNHAWGYDSELEVI